MPLRELDNPKCRTCLNTGSKQTTCLKGVDGLCFEKNFQLEYIKDKRNKE